MHVIAHVGRDPGEIRDAARRKIGAQLCEWDHMRGAARRIGADVVVVDEGIVLLHVGIRVADEAARGHAFHICLPGSPRGLHLVRNVRRTHVASGAI